MNQGQVGRCLTLGSPDEDTSCKLPQHAEDLARSLRCHAALCKHGQPVLRFPRPHAKVKVAREEPQTSYHSSLSDRFCAKASHKLSRDTSEVFVSTPPNLRHARDVSKNLGRATQLAELAEAYRAHLREALHIFRAERKREGRRGIAVGHAGKHVNVRRRHI